MWRRSVLHVTGNNIANANTPDYIRQRLVQEPAPAYRLGNVIMGLGVKAEGVQQVIDKFLDERMRSGYQRRGQQRRADGRLCPARISH